MIVPLKWVASLGVQTAGLWPSILIWTAVAAVVLIGIRGLGFVHPVIHEKTRSLLLLSLPVAVLTATLTTAGWASLPRFPVPVPEWAKSTWVEPSNPAMHGVRADVAPSRESGLPAGLGWGVAFLAAIAATGVGLLRGVRDWLALQRLRSRFRSASPHEIEGSADLTDIGGRTRLRIAVSPVDVVPMAFGLRQPVVVVPESLLSDPRALRLALLHEAVHVRRGDVLMHALEHLVAIVFAFHPLVHWLRREVREYREMACDAEVLGSGGFRPDEYATLLLRLASVGPTGSAAALGVGGTFVHLRRRIMKLHDRHPTEDAGRSHRLAWTAGLIISASAVVAVACTELTTAPRTEPLERHGNVLFNNGSYEAALTEADRTFDGKLLVYFWSPDNRVTDAVEQHLFADPQSARFLNDSFARYTVRVDSEEALAIMERYNVTSRTESPLLMLVSGRAILMTTLDEVTSAEAAADKMEQVRRALAPPRAGFGLDPSRFEIRERVESLRKELVRDQGFAIDTQR